MNYSLHQLISSDKLECFFAGRWLLTGCLHVVLLKVQLLLPPCVCVCEIRGFLHGFHGEHSDGSSARQLNFGRCVFDFFQLDRPTSQQLPEKSSSNKVFGSSLPVSVFIFDKLLPLVKTCSGRRLKRKKQAELFQISQKPTCVLLNASSVTTTLGRWPPRSWQRTALCNTHSKH